MSEKQGFHKNVESGAFSTNVEAVASRTPFFPIYTTSVFLRRGLHSPMINHQMLPFTSILALFAAHCDLRAVVSQ